MKITIVTTTINIPYCLNSYLSNFQKHNHRDIKFIIIGDLKTPNSVKKYVEGLNKADICKFDYWDVTRQKKWLKRFPELDYLIPYNSIQRRNLGYLVAYENGSDVIISVDDDNYATEDDFLGMHNIVGHRKRIDSVKSSTSWFNPCDFLETRPQRRIYYRGFPYSKRWMHEEFLFDKQHGRIVVNAGLWLGTPDVNATTHLEGDVEALALKSKLASGNIILAEGTFSPFDSQNTAFFKDVLPCMYLIVMGDEIGGSKIDRYDDIWMSYFAKKIIDHLGDFVSFGKPLVRQKRNPHNFIKDLTGELPAMALTDKLIITLGEIKLSSSDYLSCYFELAEKLRQQISKSQEYTDEEKAYFFKLTEGMFTWASVCKQIL